MSIDLEKELAIILKNRFDTVIVRNLTEEKCGCYRDKIFSGDPECPNCEGGGYVFNEHLLKCKVFYSPSFSISHAQNFDYGISYSNTYIIYFDVTDISDSIKVEDEVYELKIKQDGVPYDPLQRIRKMKVIDSYRMNLDGGKREFIKVYAKPTIV